MTLQARLTELFDDHPQVKPAHLAKAIGKSRATVNYWLTHDVKNVTGETLYDVANFFNANPEWLITGNGEKYTKENKDLLDKPNKLDEDELKEELNSCLENKKDVAMLADGYSKKQSSEDHMSPGLLKQLYALDGNIMHGITLLLSLNNAIDKDQQIVQAIEAISLSASDINIEIKPVHRPEPAHKKLTTKNV